MNALQKIVPFRKNALAVVVAAPLLMLGGCASTPKENSQIDQLETQIQSLQSAPGEEQLAPIALEEAREELDKLREIADDSTTSAEFEHQYYITQKQIEIAQELIATKRAEQVVGSADVRRKDILLAAQRQETQEAKALAASIAAHAQQLQQQVTELQTEETERGVVLTLGSVLFETGKSTLRSGAERTVQKVADFLNQYPERSILIEGFTDSRGSDSFNRQLSEDRAQAVRDLLVQQGVDNSRINTEGYGEQYPVASNETSAGRQQNRRVEIVIANENGKDVSDRSTTMVDE